MSPVFVLIANFTSKVQLIWFPNKCSHGASLRLESVLATDVTECITAVATLTSHHQQKSVSSVTGLLLTYSRWWNILKHVQNNQQCKPRAYQSNERLAGACSLWLFKGASIKPAQCTWQMKALLVLILYRICPKNLLYIPGPHNTLHILNKKSVYLKYDPSSQI